MRQNKDNSRINPQHRFFDPDDDKPIADIPPKSEFPDPEDNQIILCSECETGNVILKPYQNDKFICPSCMRIYDPYFERIKHKQNEYTLDSDDSPSNSGIIAFLDDEKQFKPPVTRIRKQLEKDEALPDYVKREVEAIEWRQGYKKVEINRNHFPDL